jgi:hypothetical protein
VQVGTIARVCCDQGSGSVVLRCAPKASLTQHPVAEIKALASDTKPEPAFEILPSMDVRVLQLNAAEDACDALVCLPSGQDGYPQCQGQTGYVESKHLVPAPAMAPCNSAAVCVMRCVQRVALRVRIICNICVLFLFLLISLQELVLGFVDYTSGATTNTDSSRVDFVRAFERFHTASRLSAAESFLKKHLPLKESQRNSAVCERVIASMLE